MPRLTLFLIAAFSWAPGSAQQVVPEPAELEEETPEIRRYSVEVIVFKYAEPVSIGTEIFLPELIEIPPDTPEGMMLDEYGNLVPAPLDGDLPGDEAPADDEPELMTDAELLELEEPLFQLTITPEEDLLLFNYVDALKRLDVYEPLLHAGWTQTVLVEEEVSPIDIREFGEPPEGLTGAFTLYLSRYLHLVVDLELLAPDDEQPSPIWQGEDDRFGIAVDERESDVGRAPTFTDQRNFGDSEWYDVGVVVDAPVYAPLTFKIDENRIFRSEEVRYYDHPRFGVIAKVVRVEEEEPEDDEFPDDTEFLLPPEPSGVAQ